MIICPIASGSSGNCIYIGTDTTHILVDAGISKKKIEEGLEYIGVSGSDVDAIFVTHEHTDHVGGIGVFSRKYPAPIYGTSKTLDYIQLSKSIGVINPSLFHEITSDSEIIVGDVIVRPMKTSHDALDSVAYRFYNGEKSIAIATDLGTYDDYIVECLSGMDIMLLEANHDVRMLELGPYPYQLKRRILSDVGHLSNEMAGRLLCEVAHDGLSTIILGHLSKENNLPELAYETVRLEIDMGDNPYHADDFNLVVAKRSEPTGIFEV